jgi:hypothetical protein
MLWRDAEARAALQRESLAAPDRPEPVARMPVVVLAPAAESSPLPWERAIADAAKWLEGRPAAVLDVREIGIEGVRARLAMSGRPADLLVGDGGAVAALKTLPVAGAPRAKRKLSSIVYDEWIVANRPFRVTLEGDLRDGDGLRVAIDGAAPVAALDRPGALSPFVEPRPGGGFDLICPPVSPGRHAVGVYGPGDEAPVVAWVEAAPPPICYLSGSGGILQSALAAQGFDVRPAQPGALPGDAALLVATDGSFDAAQWKGAVDAGCGALLAGREAVERAATGELAPWLPATAIAAPVESRPADDAEPAAPDETEPPPETTPTDPAPPPSPALSEPRIEKQSSPAPVVALALVIDRSGSMAGEKMKIAKQAALASAEILGPDDYITIVSFSDTPRVDFRIDIIGSPDKIRSVLGRIPPPGGGTFFYNALVDAANQLRFANASIRHMILITDGATADRFTADYSGLVQKILKPSQITLSTVFVVGGGEEDPDFLGLLAKWGGGRSYPAAAGDIPAFVSIEVRRVAGIAEGATKRAAPVAPNTAPPEANRQPEKPSAPPVDRKPPKPRRSDKPPKAPEPLRTATAVPEAGNRIVERLDWRGLPGVTDFCELDVVPGAAVVLRNGTDGPPLCAVRATAGGTVAVLGIGAGAGGLGEWAYSPLLREFAARMATAVARPQAQRPREPWSAIADDGVLRLRDGGDAHFPGAAENRFEGSSTPGADGRRTSSLRDLGPPIDRTAENRAIAALRASRAAGGKTPSADETNGGGSSRGAEIFFGAAILLAIGAAGARRRT